MRTLCLGYPSNKIKMILWEGTEDQQSFPVKGLNSKTPYVQAYGKRYDLTKEEITTLRQLQSLQQLHI